MSLNAKQVEQLLRPLNPRRVQKDNSGKSHLAGYDVSAHLTRIFGFGGWEKHIRSLELVSEQGTEKGGRTGWWVTYRCVMTLDVKDPAGNVIWSGDDGATGSASNQPDKGEAHDLAMKNAITYALKRCAKDLGDQFGLSLYNKGSLEPLIVRTLANTGQPAAADVEKDIPAELHPDTEEAEEAEADAGPADSPDDDEWTAKAFIDAGEYRTPKEGEKLWAAIVARHVEGRMTDDDKQRLSRVVQDRLRELRQEQEAA